MLEHGWLAIEFRCSITTSKRGDSSDSLHVWLDRACIGRHDTFFNDGLSSVSNKKSPFKLYPNS